MLYLCPRVHVYMEQNTRLREMIRFLREDSRARETAEEAENRRATNQEATRAALAREAVAEG